MKSQALLATNMKQVPKVHFCYGCEISIVENEKDICPRCVDVRINRVAFEINRSRRRMLIAAIAAVLIFLVVFAVSALKDGV